MKDDDNLELTTVATQVEKREWILETKNVKDCLYCLTNSLMFKLVLEKAEQPEIKSPTSAGSCKKQESSEKHLFLLYWLCQSLWLCGSQETVENSERDGIPDHLTCLLRNLYAGQEATVRTGHTTTDWFQIGKGVHQGCILSPCLFNLYAEYTMKMLG